MGALERANCGEGPARAAVTLVLDLGDGSLLHPIDGVSVLRRVQRDVVLLFGEIWIITRISKHGTVLLGAVVGELIVTSYP